MESQCTGAAGRAPKGAALLIDDGGCAQRGMNLTAARPDRPSSCLALQLACWFERRLHDSMAAHSSLLRLHAIDIIDPDALDDCAPAAARAYFVAEATSFDVLVGHPGVAAARGSDALAFVSTRWMAAVGSGAARPGDFARRRRARVVRVVADDGSAMVARFDDAPDVVVIAPAA